MVPRTGWLVGEWGAYNEHILKGTGDASSSHTGQGRVREACTGCHVLPSRSPQVSQYPAGCLHSSTSTTPTAPVTKRIIYVCNN